MPEEQVSELYALIQADIDQFQKDIDYVEERMDDIKAKEVEVTEATDAVETGFAGLAIEGTLFASVLGTIWDNVKRNSGGIQALTDMIWGYMGAGIDTFLAETLIPLWDEFKDKIGEVTEAEEEGTDTTKGLKDALKALYDDEGKLVGYFEDNEGAAEELNKALKDGKVMADEYGNIMVRVGDDILIFDNLTGQYVGTLDDGTAAIDGFAAGHDVLMDKVQEAAQVYGTSWEDVWDIVVSGYDNVQGLMTATEGRMGWWRQAIEAADEVWRQLSHNMIRLGIDPETGDPLSSDWYHEARSATLGANVQGPISVEQMVDYYLSGQGG